ncbi:Rpr2-domain-containing protein [Rhizophagus irregularis]|uniref:Rpr2-domain-containing protein n=1 Tax=Rhizophagus irregularis TaxID=588596 RepID=A0A2N0RAB4_9GLOM|nr:Rpr2-domain-containing protein [Rhizophagus irregularis]
MGKKKEKNSEPRLIQHREIYQRMNFLYQAATLMTTITSLGRFYINTMKTIGTKQVLRIDPSIKRTICKRCETILLPGVTSKVRIKCKSFYPFIYVLINLLIKFSLI